MVLYMGLVKLDYYINTAHDKGLARNTPATMCVCNGIWYTVVFVVVVKSYSPHIYNINSCRGRFSRQFARNMKDRSGIRVVIEQPDDDMCRTGKLYVAVT